MGNFTSKTSEDFMVLSSAIKNSPDSSLKNHVDSIFRKLMSFNKEIGNEIIEILENLELTNNKSNLIAEEKKRYERLYASGILFQSETEMVSLLEKAIDTVVRELNADEGFIVLVDSEQNISSIVAKNMDLESTRDAKEVSTSIIKKTFENLRPQRFDDLKSEVEFSSKHSVVSLGLSAVICVPLISGSNVLGAVYIDRRNNQSPFLDQDLTFLISFAKQIVKGLEVSLEILQLEEKIEEKPKQEFAKLRETFSSNEMIGKSKKLFNVLNLAAKVSDTDASVLILGENGTGKELLARALHSNSSRSTKPFVALNCGAIPPDLLESELFGYESGAFTGAVKSKPGRLELAEGGTIFLDEIGEMNVSLQAKLLRVIQTKEIDRLGGIESKKINVRFISATNKNLSQMISEKSFREDLYYRLKVIEIKIPPLRERKEDIEELVSYFLSVFSNDANKYSIDTKALQILEEYEWPGNIRELENVIQRSVILAATNVISVNDLPPEILTAENAEAKSFENKTLAEAEDDFRKLFITKILRKVKSKSDAAKILGINRSHLHKLISQLEISE